MSPARNFSKLETNLSLKELPMIAFAAILWLPIFLAVSAVNFVVEKIKPEELHRMGVDKRSH
jgi:hypothetical protein